MRWNGRALNRRVEIRTGSAEPGPPPALEPLPVTPAAGVTTVDMELGGFGETVPTPVPR